MKPGSAHYFDVASTPASDVEDADRVETYDRSVARAMVAPLLGQVSIYPKDGRTPSGAWHTDRLLVLDPKGEPSRRTMVFPGMRLERRSHVTEMVLRLGLDLSVVKVDRVPAFLPAHQHRHDWIDRRDVVGVLRKMPRCCYCRRIIRVIINVASDGLSWRCIDGHGRPVIGMADRRIIHSGCLDAELDRQQQVETEVRQVRLVGRQAKLMQKLAHFMDTPMTIAEAAKLLPGRPSVAALTRRVLRGKLNSTRVNGERRLRGRDLLPLVKSWIDTGRAPCQSRSNPRAEEQEAMRVAEEHA